MKGRGILLAVLVYFSVDLSAPEIPGAFVFEADDSVEVSVTSASFVTNHVPAPARVAVAAPQARVDRHDRPAASRQAVSPSPPIRLQLPRATLAAAAFEDSH